MGQKAPAVGPALSREGAASQIQVELDLDFPPEAGPWDSHMKFRGLENKFDPDPRVKLRKCFARAAADLGPGV